eukprot:1604711-Pyramimonas_sp.AAC.1
MLLLFESPAGFALFKVLNEKCLKEVEWCLRMKATNLGLWRPAENPTRDRAGRRLAYTFLSRFCVPVQLPQIYRYNSIPITVNTFEQADSLAQN